MPPQTPKQKLIEAVRTRFLAEGFHRPTAYPMAVLAVEAFYAENQESEFYHIVAQEALNLITEAIPPFVTHMRAAFESMQAAMNHVTESARVAGPWADLAMRLDQERKRHPTKFDASGLPAEEGTMADVPSAPADRQAEPCIEEGCGADAVPGTAFCADCMPTPSTSDQLMAVVRDHIMGDTTEHPVPASVLHFEDDDIARLERDYPTDRITGAPHHYILNGDHTACGCNGHDPSCEVWDVPFWHHKPTLCRISRTLCINTPKHTYGQACGEYHENLAELVRPPVVGQTTEGEDVRGPAAG